MVSCENCLYWRSLTKQQIEDAGWDSRYRLGLCCRVSPQPQYGSHSMIVVSWPVVNHDDCCGEGA